MKSGKQVVREYLKNTLSVPRGREEQEWSESRSEYPAASGFGDGAEPLEVLLLHEDLQTGLRAKYILDNLEAKLATKPRFLIELWRFDMLQEPELQERAVQDAKHANIVIISLHGNDELPAVVRNWLDRWIKARSSSSCALVASLDASVQGSAAAEWTLDHLRRTAAAAGLDIFPHFGDIPVSARNWTLHQPQMRPMAPTLTAYGPHFAGGIND
jgi:hypothetical protein